ncbi:MAG TPA: glycosyl hydrolase family 5 [Elusimicrobia bacterium]|nr:glycosyl hydrolase family 5 [Elusimicrobiota bacterium]
MTALSCLLSLLLSPASAAGFVKARGAELIAPDGKPLITKGIGLGNWLVPEGYMFHFEKVVAPRQIQEVFEELVGPEEARQFWERWYDEYTAKEDLLRIRSLGFDLIRIPFNAKLLNPEEHPELWDERQLNRLERTVDWAKEAGLWVVLDLHAAHGGQTGDNIDDSAGTPWLYESEASRARTLEVWQRVAERFKDEPAVLGYELLNEPIADHADKKKYNPMLEPLYRDIVEAIREADQEHLIFLGGAQWNTEFSMFKSTFDPNTAYAFHRYWADPSDAGLKTYLETRARLGAPMWMSESGENTDEWVAAFRTTLEKNGIGWAFWPYKKMDSTSSVVSFERPPHWDKVIAYADKLRGGTYEEKRKARPTLQESREALEGLLKNIRLERCRTNEGYLKALGLK